MSGRLSECGNLAAIRGYWHANYLDWTLDDTLLACYSGSQSASLWDTQTGKWFWPEFENELVTFYPTFSPDGQKMAAFDGGRGYIWSVAQRSRLARVPIPELASGNARAAWSPDGRRIAWCNNDPKKGTQVFLCDAETLRVVHTLRDATGPFAWSPDSTTLVTRGAKVTLWNAETGEVLRTLEAKFNGAHPFAWSPDGKTLAVGDDLGLWDPVSGQRQRQLEKLDDQNNNARLAWLPDGQTIVGIFYGAVKVAHWEAATGKLQKTLPCPSTGGHLFSTNRHWVASYGPPWPNACLLWQTATAQPRAMLVALRNQRTLSLSPEGHYRGPANVEKELVYVVQTDAGQETLTPAEFAAKYHWKNDPERVRLTGP